MTFRELMKDYLQTDKGRFGKAIERLIHQDIVIQQREYRVTPNSYGQEDVRIYFRNEEGKRKSLRMEIKTGCGSVSYTTSTPAFEDLFPKADFILYWAEPDETVEMEDHIRVVPRLDFIEMLKGYELANGKMAPMIRPVHKQNRCNIQSFTNSERRYDYWIGSLNLYPTYRTWKESLGR